MSQPESTEEDDTSLAVHKVTVARWLRRLNNSNIIITRLQQQSYLLSLLKLLFSGMGRRAVWYTY